MKKLIIFGNGIITEAVYNSMIDDELFDFKIECFCVEKKYKKKNKFLDLPNYDFETINKRFKASEYYFFVAVGYQQLNTLRQNILHRVRKKGFRIASYMHYSHKKNSTLKIGKNCFLMKDTIIHPNVKIEDNVFIWGGAIVCHHSKLKKNCWVTAGSKIMGSATIGENTFIAGGSLISHNVTIGKKCFVGANSLINKNLAHNSVVITKPSDKLRMTSDSFLKTFNFI
jgi:sugar O-acyltransferase (sialic acid O-acetyltransferase NeuD family)